MRIRLLLGLFGLFLLSSTYVLGQDTASVTGTVRDPSGASVVNAQVAVVNVERGINRTTVTNSDGEYSVPALPAPGSYDVTVTAEGFKKFVAKGIVLNVARRLESMWPYRSGPRVLK